jgi:hypothetical protein
MNNMNDFTNSDPYENKIEDVLCRGCGKTFQINAQYDKNGFPVSFQLKYCPECNLPKITGNNGSWGTINIESAKIAQKSVEGLEERFEKTEKALHSTINLTFEHGKKIDELNKQNQNRFAEINDLEQNTKRNKDNILNNKIRLDFFHAKQSVFNKEQTKFNDTVLEQIKEIHKTLIIGFSVFVFFMLVTWGYLTYTFFKH